MMKLQRVTITSDEAGKVVKAVLQESDTDDGRGNMVWHDVRPLPVSPDGVVTLPAYEATAGDCEVPYE